RMDITSHEEIGGRLARGVRAVGRQWRFFRELPGCTKAPVNLIGRYLDESRHGKTSRRIEQDLRSEHVCANKWPRVLNAAINMAFGRKIENRRDAIRHHGVDLIAIGDIASHETIARMVRKVAKILQIPRVGETVEIDHGQSRVRFQQVANEIATNETTA